MADSIVSQLSFLEPLEIRLTKGYTALVDPIDADLAELKWTARCPRQNNVYAIRQRHVDGKPSFEHMHRTVLERALDRPLLPDEQVDHINGNGIDNRRSNLRVATHAQNMQSRRTPKNNTSGYKGVSLHKPTGRWEARISLGLFDTPQEAHAAYCAAGRELHGEFFNPGATPQEPTE